MRVGLALVGSRAALTRTLGACCAVTGAVHLASTMLNTLLPFHVVALGGSKTQVGLLFSVTTVVSMGLRPVVGGWIDRVGVRPVVLPGLAALTGTSLALQLARSPSAVIALMVGLGLANGLVSTTTTVLAARSGPAIHRGEALGLYYLASSLGIAVAPPLAFLLLTVGGMPASFVAVTGLALAVAGLVRLFPRETTGAVAGAGPGWHLWSRPALPASGALVLATLGHSAIYGFLPLYAIGHGQTGAVGWFFTVYPLWVIACRALLRGLSDRVGRARVILPAMALTAGGFFLLALPPTAASLIAAALLLASGASVLYPTLAALVVDRAPEGERGLALGTLSGAWDLGVVVGSALVGAVVDRVSYGAGFAVGGAGATLGLMAFAVTEQRQARLAVAPRPST